MKYIMLGMGYISGKHLDAIKNTGGELVAYHDIHDVVGHVDSRFINARYYPDFMHLDCFVDRHWEDLDMCVVLLPNHLHNPACRWAMNHGMDVICEKPLVLQEKNLDELGEVQWATGKRVNTILQMRLHGNAKNIKRPGETASVKIVYHTPRGPWFKHGSWKANPDFSGGLATSIGIHLFDLCEFAYGPWISWEICRHRENEYVLGWVEYEGAVVEFDLSVDASVELRREFNVNGVSYDFTNGFMDLHTASYEKILADRGFGIEDARGSIRLVEMMRCHCGG